MQNEPVPREARVGFPGAVYHLICRDSKTDPFPLPLKGSVLTTLAAAYAGAGDFDQAIKWQSKYISTASEADKPGAQARLALYEKRKPYHMGM